MNDIKSLITSTRGKFFTVRFIKKDGTVRRMTCRTGVAKHLKGGSLAYDPASYDLKTVFDVQKKQYRMINLSTIFSFQCGKVSWNR